MTDDMNTTTTGRMLLNIINNADHPEELVNYLLSAAAELRHKTVQVQST